MVKAVPANQGMELSLFREMTTKMYFFPPPPRPPLPWWHANPHHRITPIILLD